MYLAPVSEIEKLMAHSTPEQMKTGMDTWGKWMKKNEAILVDMGAPLGKTKRVTTTGISDAKNDVTGYSIVKAESREEAAKLFVGHPHLEIPGASIDVLDVVPMPGM